MNGLIEISLVVMACRIVVKAWRTVAKAWRTVAKAWRTVAKAWRTVTVAWRTVVNLMVEPLVVLMVPSISHLRHIVVADHMLKPCHYLHTLKVDYHHITLRQMFEVHILPIDIGSNLVPQATVLHSLD